MPFSKAVFGVSISDVRPGELILLNANGRCFAAIAGRVDADARIALLLGALSDALCVRADGAWSFSLTSLDPTSECVSLGCDWVFDQSMDTMLPDMTGAPGTLLVSQRRRLMSVVHKGRGAGEAWFDLADFDLARHMPLSASLATRWRLWTSAAQRRSCRPFMEFEVARVCRHHKSPRRQA